MAFFQRVPFSEVQRNRVVIVVSVLLLAALGGRSVSSWSLIGIVGLLGVGALLVKPEFGPVMVLVLALAVPLDLGTGTGVSLNLAAVLPLFLALFVLFRALVWRSIPEVLSSLPVQLLLVFSLVATVAFVVGYVFWSVQVPKASITVQLGQLFIYLSAVCTVFVTGQGLKNMAWLQRLVEVFLCVAGFQLVGAYVPGLARVIPIAPDSHGGMFWVWLTAMVGSQLMFNSALDARRKLLLVVVLCPMALFLFGPVGRTWTSGWLPASVTILAILLLRLWRWKWIYLLAVGMILFLSLNAIYGFAGGDDEAALSGGSRLVLWQAVLESVWQRPILGLGMVAYRYYHYMNPLVYGQIYWIAPQISSHNDFVDVFAQTGVLGLSLLLVALLSLGRAAWRLRETAVIQAEGFAFAYTNGVLAGLLGTAVVGMLGNWVLPFIYNGGFSGFRASLIGWVLMGGLVALERMTKRRVVDGRTASPGVGYVA
jgi:O-antigen ligase